MVITFERRSAEIRLTFDLHVICGEHTKCRFQSKRRIWPSTFRCGQLLENSGRTCSCHLSPEWRLICYYLVASVRLYVTNTGSSVGPEGTYLRCLRAFLDESDSAVVRWLHRRLAQELASCVVKSTSWSQDFFSATTTASPKRRAGVTSSRVP